MTATLSPPVPSSDLEALPGVGPTMAKRLRRAFDTDGAFFAAAREGDLARIAAVEGVGMRRAAAIVRLVRGDEADDAFLADPGARRIADQIVDRVAAMACTPVGRDRLRLLAPLPDAEAALEHIEQVMAYADQAAALDRDQTRKHLRRLRRLDDAPAKVSPSHLVVASDPSILEALHAKGIHRHASLDGLRGIREAEGFETVSLVGEAPPMDLPENVDEVPWPADLHDIVPHVMLRWGEHHRATLTAAAALCGAESACQEALDALADHASTQLTVRDLEQAVQDERERAEAELTTRVADLHLSGAEVLAAMGAQPPQALRRVLEDVLSAARGRLRQTTGLDLSPFVPGLPLRIDEEEMEQARKRLEARQARDAHQARLRVAQRLARLRPRCEAEVEGWLERDAHLALGWFVHDHGLSMPTFQDHLAIQDAVNLDLASMQGVQPITYHIGRQERAALLTGANSGGKSTLLEHLAQCVILARMGLPVPGTAPEVPWVEAVHLVTAKRGMDAGAFETFLTGFLPLVQGDAKRLVLVDEVEAVTELEAAGRILGFFVDRLANSGSLGVIVTHLAPQVLQHADASRIRIDGIEAKGLDAEHRLIVDRTPVMGRFARSTPELVVQRLAARAKGADRALYDDLLATLAA